MTARENILMAYHHQEPLWVPSQILDQDTCLSSCVPEGPDGFGITTDILVSPGPLSRVWKDPW